MSKFSVRKPLTIFVAVIAIIILGIVALTRMTPDLLPNMDFPYVVIMTTYPGQSPEIVEEEITRPLEQSMATLEHIKEVTSSSSENYSLVMLEFDTSVNMDTIGVDIQQSISALQGTWDDSIGTPYVLKINPSVLPVAIAAVSKEDMDITELSDFIDDTIVPKLEGVTGVARVTTSGSIYRQLNVIISQEKIDDVNRRMEQAVNQQMDDAQEDLEEQKADLDDAQEELDSAQEELDSGKEALIGQTASAQAALSGQQSQLLEGKLQLQQQISELESSREALTSAIELLQQADAGYVQAETQAQQLQEEIAGLDQRAAEITSQIAALNQQIEDLNATKAQLQAAIDQLTQAGAAPAPEPSAAPAPDQGADPGLAEGTEPGLAGAADPGSGGGTDPGPGVDQLAQLQVQLAEVESQILAAQGQISALQAELEANQAQRAELDVQLQLIQGSLDALDEAMSAQGIEGHAGLQAKLTELQSNVEQVDEALRQMNTYLEEINSGQGQLSQAMGAISQGQSQGILELANAASEINTNSAALQAAMDQIESGLDQLEDSRSEALSQADLSGTITLENITQILSAQNFSMPAGYVAEDGVNYMVSVGDEIADEEELKNLLLFDTGEDAIGPVTLADVAEVFITDNSDSVYAKLNGENSVMLSFDKQSNAATAEVGDGLKAKFAQLQEQYPGLDFIFLMDQGDYIHLIIDSIVNSLLTGAVFAVLVLFLFLRDLRPTFITLVSIPVSVIFAFVLMYFSGVTLNMISMSGLAVAVGMLVDNSIVVIENIYRLRGKGATPVQAAVTGAKQVAGSVTSSTLTTVCVFLPIVFVQGITRQLFTDLAITMSYALLASLVIALTLVPAMAKGMLKTKKQKKEKREGFIYRTYRVIARWNLRHKWVVLTASILLLVFTSWTCLQKGFSFMPDIDMNTVNISVIMPEGTDRPRAVELADQVLERIDNLSDLDTEYVGAMMGSSSLTNTQESYDVSIYVGLPEGQSGAEAGERIAESCWDLPCEISFDSAMMNMDLLIGSGVSVDVYGDDLQSIQEGARAIGDAMTRVEGIASVDNGLEQSQTAYHIRVDKNEAMAKGFTVAQIYMDLTKDMTNSSTALSMKMDNVTADVVVQTEDTITMEELMNHTFETTDAEGNRNTFHLKDVAEVEPTTSLATINRIDQKNYLSVTSTLEKGYNITLVTSAVDDELAKLDLPDGVSYEFTGENETVMESVQDLMLMLVIGVILVYFVMVAQFQSLKSPFIVMFTIPLAFTGGFAALLLFHMDISIVALIGFVMLVGIIVNNGIVLVDYVNQLRAEGMKRRAALIEAGVTRMRPIFMTSLTTILGLIDMAIGKDVGTSIMQPVAVVCIGGLLYATLMTLFVVPCIYDIINRKKPVVLTEEDMDFQEL